MDPELPLPPTPRPPRPPLQWGNPDMVLGFTTVSAHPERGVHYMCYEPKAGEWRANIALGSGRLSRSTMVTTGAHLLESAKMICEDHWQNLPPDEPI